LGKANREAERSRQVTQFLQEMLKDVGPSVALGRDTTMLREILDRTNQRLDKLKEQQAKIPAGEKKTLKNALQSIIQLYHATEKSKEEAKWKRELVALKS
jgi:predicted RNA-binding protein Jag